MAISTSKIFPEVLVPSCHSRRSGGSKCGVPPILPDFKPRVVDESGNDCPPNTPGEVLVRGPIVTKGYFNNPAADAESFKDSFLCTGDIGFFQEDRLHIVVRFTGLFSFVLTDYSRTGKRNLSSIRVFKLRLQSSRLY